MWTNRRCAVALSVLLAASSSGHASHVVVGDLRKYRTVGDVHGLFEINAAGQKFLRAHNRKHRTDWIGFGPDLRMQVERCLVPLRSRWAVPDDPEEGPRVIVTCDKSIQKRRWDMFVHAFRKSEARGKWP